MRDPLGGIRNPDAQGTGASVLAVLKGFVLVVALVAFLVAVPMAIEAVLGPVLPEVATFPATILGVAVVAVGGTYAYFRIRDRLSY